MPPRTFFFPRHETLSMNPKHLKFCYVYIRLNGFGFKKKQSGFNNPPWNTTSFDLQKLWAQFRSYTAITYKD